MLAKAQGACQALSNPLRVLCEVYPPDRRRRDLDNAWKTAADALTHAGVWQDDHQIADLRLVRMEPRQGGQMVVTVEEMADDAYTTDEKGPPRNATTPVCTQRHVVEVERVVEVSHGA